MVHETPFPHPGAAGAPDATMQCVDEPVDVAARIGAITNAVRRRDAQTMIELMSRVSGQPARLAGPSIIGVGHYHYRYPSGREGDGPAAAFSPRSTATVVYLPDGVGAHRDNLEKLGPHTSGVGCLYLKDLSKVDISVLESIIRDSYATLTAGTFGHRAREWSDRRPGGERSSEG